MIKVCFIISGFGYSGAEIVLGRYLKDNKLIDPYFIVLYKKKEIYEKFCNIYGKNKVFSLNMKHNKNSLRFIPWYDMTIVKYKIDKKINEINPDIIYSNNTMETMLMGLYAKNSNIPIIGHIHDMKSSIHSVIRRYVTKKNFKNYNCLITVSNATKKDWNEKSMIVIYNGLENNYFNSDINSYEKIRTVGFIGSISRRKGIDFILNEIDDFVKKDLNIIIAYSNIEDYGIYDKLEEKVLKYPQKVILKQDLKDEEVIDFYDSIDLLIVPSRQDPLPTVIMECMSRGKLVIGNNVGGIPEMIDENTLIFNTKKSEKIYEKIINIESLGYEKLTALAINQCYKCKRKFNEETKRMNINKIIVGEINSKLSKTITGSENIYV